MKNQPRWIIWLAATVVLWAAWIAFAYLPLRQRDAREEAQRTEWADKQSAMLARIRTAPDVMTRIEELDQRLDSVSADLPTPLRLKEYMDLLTALGRDSGIRSIEASPELSSMMALSKSTTGPRKVLDTLMVELTAVGEFHDIGQWLDKIEAQTAFRHWRAGRWDRGEEPGTIRFSGAAAFLVAVPKGEPS
jgi:Tfp pilus assembly protein PilO